MLAFIGHFGDIIFQTEHYRNFRATIVVVFGDFYGSQIKRGNQDATTSAPCGRRARGAASPA